MTQRKKQRYFAGGKGQGMIYKPKGRRYYRIKFHHQGKLIHRCTRATDKKTARSIEAKIRTELAAGNWGILEAKPAPTLDDFLKKDFLPFVESKSKSKPKTVEYYSFGVRALLDAGLGKLRLDEITDQHASQYATRKSRLSPSTINCGLRTLRRALNLAFQWGKLDRPARITLAKGERQRERVLTRDEASAYLDACPEPWRDVATIMLGTGLRPGELYELRWENVVFGEDGGLIKITHGKSRAARRVLPMFPEVKHVLQSRWEEQKKPIEGWVFPSDSELGHFEEGTAKGQHARAIALIERGNAAYKTWSKGKKGGDWAQTVAESTAIDSSFLTSHEKVVQAGLAFFAPYCLRHTALTWFAESGCDPFTLARIAGHSSITITQRYCHPQADAIESAFKKLAAQQKVVTEGGAHQKKLKA
jgi:integrase